MVADVGFVSPKIRPEIAKIAHKLQMLQRKRAIILKSRIMNTNRLQAVVAGTMGYHAGMPEKERTAVFGKASALIDDIEDKAFQKKKGEWLPRLDFDLAAIDHPLASVIVASLHGIHALDVEKDKTEKAMLMFAADLHVVPWVEHKNQRGFGLLFLAIIVGECGDLANYDNPGKIWRRMGCAPWTYDGKTLMGATWRSGREGKLPAEEWSQKYPPEKSFGYSPRRRSIAYLIGEGIVKQNDDGPYRRRYDEAKERCAANHPDYKPLRCHRHGMLLATKMLLKNLWIEWNR